MMTEGPAESHARARNEGATAFADFAAEVRSSVDARLKDFLDGAVAKAAAQGEAVGAVIDAVRALSMRGGKRLRAVLVAAAYEACGGEGGGQAVTMAGVALELLQSYLLIHDDWMDEDDTRRGGPSVHAMLRARFGSIKDGDAAAILAGDHASALAQQALLSIALPASRVLEAARVFASIQEDVILGQLLDVHGGAGSNVEAMHDLKTGSYTVRGPLRLGAVLAGASPEKHDALVRFAAPLGVAFQLRDDLLGTFGDPRETGKPAGNDVRRGKHTALVAELAGDPEAKALLARAFGARDAAQADVDAIVRRMIDGGARARVEARLRDLLAQAQRELRAAPFELRESGSRGSGARGKAVLEGAVLALGERER